MSTEFSLKLSATFVEVGVVGDNRAEVEENFDELLKKYGAIGGTRQLQEEANAPILEADGTLRDAVTGDVVTSVVGAVVGKPKRQYTPQQMGIIKQRYAMLGRKR